MVNVFSSHRFNKLLLSCILTSFTLVVVTPPAAYAQMNIGLNDVTFTLNMKKYVEKIRKYQEREDINKLLNTVFDMRQEIEAYSGLRFNIDHEINVAEQEIKNNGGKVNKREMATVRKFILKKEKKAHHRFLCIAAYIQDASDISIEEFKAFQLAGHRQDRDNEEEQVKDLPTRLAIGITMILAGSFLCGIGSFLKMPMIVTSGQALFFSGVNYAIDGCVNKQEEEDKKRKENR